MSIHSVIKLCYPMSVMSLLLILFRHNFIGWQLLEMSLKNTNCNSSWSESDGCKVMSSVYSDQTVLTHWFCLIRIHILRQKVAFIFLAIVSDYSAQSGWCLHRWIDSYPESLTISGYASPHSLCPRFSSCSGCYAQIAYIHHRRVDHKSWVYCLHLVHH